MKTVEEEKKTAFCLYEYAPYDESNKCCLLFSHPDRP